MTSPFRKAPQVQQLARCASSAAGRDISPLVATKPQPKKDPKSHLAGLTVNLPYSPTESSSASHGTLGTMPVVPPTTRPHITSVPSVAPNLITPPHVNASNYSRILTPYSADSYESFLAHFDISSRYPTLVHRLRNGFPIGNFSPLLDTYIHPNHGSFREHEPSILKYISEEVSLGHMSGPFSEFDLRREFGQQHVISSPLGAVDKAGEPGKIRAIRDLSHKGKAPHSVNDEVNADEETTKWGKASDMAEVVSPFLLSQSVIAQRSSFSP